MGGCRTNFIYCLSLMTLAVITNPEGEENRVGGPNMGGNHQSVTQ